jgi:hypothetical protein
MCVHISSYLLSCCFLCRYQYVMMPVMAARTFGVILRHVARSWQAMFHPAQRRKDSDAFINRSTRRIQRRFPYNLVSMLFIQSWQDYRFDQASNPCVNASHRFPHSLQITDRSNSYVSRSGGPSLLVVADGSSLLSTYRTMILGTGGCQDWDLLTAVEDPDSIAPSLLTSCHHHFKRPAF